MSVVHFEKNTDLTNVNRCRDRDDKEMASVQLDSEIKVL